MKKCKGSSRGFTLIEISIVLVISILALTWGLWAKVNAVRQENAQAQGDALVTLSNAVGTYMTNNYTNLVNNAAIAGYADIHVPTIPELIATRLLSNNFSVSNFYGSGYQIAVSRFPAGCVAPNCDIISLVNLTAGIVDYRTGLVDGPTLGAAARRMGANGGFSNRVTPGTINGTSGGWSVANPVLVAGAPVPGVLAIRGGYGSSGWSQFLRRDGTLPMTGGLNMGNNNINNTATLNSNAINNATSIATTTLASTAAVTVGTTLVVAGNTTLNNTLTVGGATLLNNTLGVTGSTTTNGITNTGAISTTTLGTTAGATIGTTLNVAGTTTTHGVTNTGNISNTGNITNVGLISNTGSITATGDVTAARYLPTTVVVAGSSCVGLDGYQARTAAGSLASCINGIWTTPDTTKTIIPCAAQTGAWSGCSANLGATVPGASTSVTPTLPSGATGAATFVCISGVQVLQPGSSCVIPQPGCAAQGVSWGGCSASVSALVSGASKTVTPSSPSGASGSATYLCTSGTLSLQAGSSCTMPACPAQTNYWSSCSAAFTSVASGGSQTKSATAPAGATGSATFSCNNGSWVLGANSCVTSAGCAIGAPVSWIKTQPMWGANSGTAGDYTCPGTIPVSGVTGTSTTVTTTDLRKTGTATYTCQSNGTWMLNAATATCNGKTKALAGPMALAAGTSYGNCSKLTLPQATIVWGYYRDILKRLPDVGGYSFNCNDYLTIGSQVGANMALSQEGQVAMGLGHIAPDAEANVCGDPAYAYPWTIAFQQSLNVCKLRPGL